MTHKGWHSQNYLPHFNSRDIVQFVTFRLADSLPEHIGSAHFSAEKIDQNPVKAGLLAEPRFWAYASACLRHDAPLECGASPAEDYCAASACLGRALTTETLPEVISS
jgi:hypothetical protein